MKSLLRKELIPVCLALAMIILAGCTSDDALAGKASFFKNNKDFSFLYKLNADFITKIFSTDVVLIFDPRCGNGILDDGEECDDGNTVDVDGCSASCYCPTSIRRLNAPGEPLCGSCGDGIIALGEECDDGNTVDGDGCSAACAIERSFTFHVSFPTVCGNSILERGEECDDGNAIDNDGCSTCLLDPLPVCGNGIVEAGEECDGDDPLCRDDCTIMEERECYRCIGDGEGCSSYSTPSFCPPWQYESRDACFTGCGTDVVVVPPDDGDVMLCEEPDPFNLPVNDLPPGEEEREGTRYRNPEGGTRHISQCEPLGSPDCAGAECMRLIVCSDEGTTVNVIPCPDGLACRGGACVGDPIWSPPRQCFDSDGGINPFTAGEVIEFNEAGEPGMSQRDVCWSDGFTLNERYCVEDRFIRAVTINCRLLDNAVCFEGRCVHEPDLDCSETDSGDDPLNPGVMTVSRFGVGSSSPDSCDFFQTRLTENYCVGDSPSNRLYLCSDPALCEAEECLCQPSPDGATCVPGTPPLVTCVDPDNAEAGDGIFSRTAVRLEREDGVTRTERGDVCHLENVVLEAVCVGNVADSQLRTCPEGLVCSGGACTEPAPGDGEAGSCSRTGPAGDIGGYVIDAFNVVQPDICVSATALEIYGCDAEGNAVVEETINCADEGMLCRSGLCRAE